MSPDIALRMLATAICIVLAAGSVLAQSARPLAADEVADAEAVLAAAPDQGLPGRESSLPLGQALLDYARAQHGGRIDPPAADPDWTMRPKAYDADAALAASLTNGNFDAWLSDLPPSEARYRALVAARRRYAAAAAAGGWSPSLPPLGLKRGMVARGVVDLRRRLDEEGFQTAPVRGAATFDATLDQALRQFQRHRDIPETGVLGARTRAALAVAPQDLLAIIDANLERLRWLPRDLPADRVEVNIASASLKVLVDGATSLTMRTVVGDATHRTPILAAGATGVVVNPPWHVPNSIATRELYPREARDPGYLARNDFKRVGGVLRQAAGDKSALGRLKIELDDPYEIYLHDTPERAYFDLPRRALSHGCVRLQRPVDLAAALLAPQGVSRDDLEALIAAKSTRHLRLTAPMPVFIVYETAEADADGAVNFHPDIYGWDDELDQDLIASAVIRSPH